MVSGAIVRSAIPKLGRPHGVCRPTPHPSLQSQTNWVHHPTPFTQVNLTP